MKRCKSKLMPGLLAIVLVFLISSLSGVYAQQHVISGTVYDQNSGTPLLGATVAVKGTTNGTVTDLDGKFSLTTKADDILIVSYIGYLTEELNIAGQTTFSINLVPDIASLEQVVVIGYGVQKKKLNTGATLNVAGEDIQQLNTTSAMDALKGLSPGVSITQNNGIPGAGNKIFIRGIGTIGNYAPLYIVDGVAVGNIDNLSPSDIESIDVLKDAASAAIYGSRAANGVVLVTTKRGRKSDAPIVDYSGYYGIQNVAKGPELLNAQKYTELVIEAAENAGTALPNFATQVPNWAAIQSGEWEGTNWFEEIEQKNAPVMSHALNIAGGTEVSTYSLGASYYGQQGILGKQANNDYQRINLRLNSEHILFRNSNRNIITLGENITYTNEKNPTIRAGNIYWSDVHNMLVSSPYLPMYTREYDVTDPYKPILDNNGNDPASPYHYAIRLNQNEGNPVAAMENNSKWNTNNNNTIIGNAYLNISPVRNLNIRSAFGINNWYGSSRQWIPPYNLSAVNNYPYDQVHHDMNSGYTWTSTNTATYDFKTNDHNFTVLAGMEFIKNAVSLSLFGENDSSIFGKPEYAYLDNFAPLDKDNANKANFGGRDNYGWAMASYFGRLSYNYKETYMATVVMRYDGSSNFAEGNRWGSFPSVSAGWVLSNESFMETTSAWLNMAKLRASWGQNGNQDINRSFVYLSSISFKDVNYYFGPDKNKITVGSTPARVPNPNISWETSEQTNIGLDMNFLNNRLQTAFDWYRKDTKDWLVQKISSVMDGTEAPFVNGGLIRNSGIETMFRWNDNAGNFKYGVAATFAYNHNEVLEVPSEDSIFHGPDNVLSQGTEEMFRAEAGFPIGYFWGYETDGIFKSEEEAAAWVRPEGSVNEGEPYYTGPDSRPGMQQHAGDLKFVDQNNDGIIDEADKVMIGNPHPDVIVGLQLTFEFKGVYLNVTGNGMFGQEVAKNYRSVDNYLNNYTQYDYDNIWRDDNTSGTLPRVVQGGHRNYQYISDIFIYKGNFFRISNLTLGYNLQNVSSKFPFERMQVYVAANNLYNFTKYPGMDPEVGYSPEDSSNPDNDFKWGSGIDLGLYPQARTFMVGTNITF